MAFHLPTASLIFLITSSHILTLAFLIHPGRLSAAITCFTRTITTSIPLTDPVYETQHLLILPQIITIWMLNPRQLMREQLSIGSDDYDGDERPIGDGFDIGADEVRSELSCFSAAGVEVVSSR